MNITFISNVLEHIHDHDEMCVTFFVADTVCPLSLVVPKTNKEGDECMMKSNIEIKLQSTQILILYSCVSAS